MLRQCLFVWASLLALAWSSKPDRKVIIRNQSGRRIEMNWIHPTTKQTALMTDPDILHGAEFTMDSYVSHRFELRELPSRRTNKCTVPDKCQTATFAVNNNEKQGVCHRRGPMRTMDWGLNPSSQLFPSMQASISNTKITRVLRVKRRLIYSMLASWRQRPSCMTARISSRSLRRCQSA